MKIAIVGSGISGMTAAWYLQQQHEVTVFEKNEYWGGHTDTHEIHVENKNVYVDTGFIVFNETNYPVFCDLLKQLDVAYQPSDMSFSVDNRLSRMAYNPSKGKKIFAEMKNFANVKFWKMLLDIKKFYQQGQEIISSKKELHISLEEFLEKGGYSKSFAEEHLYPMAGALWSMTSQEVREIPLHFVLSFFSHHRMLQVKDRPEWKTVTQGSASYIKALREKMHNVEWKAAQVISVERNGNANLTYRYDDKDHTQEFDAVIFACHSDQALEILKQPTQDEIEVIGAFEYSKNKMVLHSDANIMPKNDRLWASWNVGVTEDNQQPHYCITYWMNLLQNLDCKTQFFASLNPNQAIQSDKIWVERDYEHPKYQLKSFLAQQQWEQVNGPQNTYFCGAYWGWGFHEDGAKSGLRVAQQILNQVDKRLAS